MSGKKIYISKDNTALVEKYTKRFEGLSSGVNVIVERYDELIRQERDVIRHIFTNAEFMLMLDNALSTSYGPASAIPGAVLSDVAEEIPEVFTEFAVDKKSLVSRLGKLTRLQEFALVDWLEEARESIGETDDTKVFQHR